MWRLYTSNRDESFMLALVTPLFAFELYDRALDFISDRYRIGFALWWQWNRDWTPGAYRFLREFEKFRYDAEPKRLATDWRPNFS